MTGALPDGIMAAGRSQVMGTYSKQFKEEAIKLVTKQGYTPAEAARKLGIPDTTYQKWVKKSGWTKNSATPLAADPQALQVQVRALEAQVKRLEMEKEILKKATAFFASQSL
jgi:transposase